MAVIPALRTRFVIKRNRGLMKEAKDRPLANRYTNFIPWALLGLSAALICFFAHHYSRFPGDLDIARWLQGIDLPLFRPAMEAIDAMGFRLMIPLAVILCALLLWVIRRRTEAFFVAMTLFAYWSTLIIKLVVDRPRPPDLDTGVVSWYLAPGPAFPSGHVMHFVLFYGLLLYLAPTLIKNRRARLALQVFLGSMIVLVGPSVVYTARHWPSDALGGYIVGGFFLAALVWGYNRCKDGRFDRWYEAVRLNGRRTLRMQFNGRWLLRKG